MRNKSKSRPDRSNIDWRNQTRTGENFRKSNFYRARFEFGKFTECDFSAVSAKHACFIKTDLSGSNFTGANLEGANFGGADLSGVNFKSAILSHCNFEGAIIEGASFINAKIGMARKLKLTEEQVHAREPTSSASVHSSSWTEQDENRMFELWGAPHKRSTLFIGSSINRTPNAVLSRLNRPVWNTRPCADFFALVMEDNRRRVLNGDPEIVLPER